MKSSSQASFNRAKELRLIINKANHDYYVLDSPTLKDSVYDSLYKELIELEKKDPSLKTADSPSQRLGGPPAKRFQTVQHGIPLLSLDNAFNLYELNSWYNRALKIINNQKSKIPEDFSIKNLSLVGELKIDGNAIALRYENGLLVKAATRGDGTTGEEITNNVKTITSIPLKLNLKNPPQWVEIRGEAFIPNKTFKLINTERAKNGNNLFANPRNACAGTLRQLDPKVVYQRKLDFFAYTIHLPDNWTSKEKEIYNPKDQWKSLLWLKKTGFKVNPNAILINNLEELKVFYEYWDEHRKNLPYATDGVVIKVNDLSLQKSLGFTQKAPRWAIALKYQAEEATTQLLNLSYQVGRTGAVTPVAEFKTITLAGTSVSRATVHNANRLSYLDLHSGDTIVVRKAGEIIPEITKVILELRTTEAKRLYLPKNCPECSSLLFSDNKEAITRCINNQCPAILKGSLKHWVSKNALDIDGFGHKLIEKLVERNIVKSIADLYKLDLKSLSELERLGEKSASKLLKEIKDSKTKPWHKLLYGLGIFHVGESNAKLIAHSYKSIVELKKVAIDNNEELQKIQGIGEEITQSLKKWFLKVENNQLINELENEGLLFKSNEELYPTRKNKFNHNIKDKSFVLTGSLSSLTRSEAENLIEEAGGQVRTSISKNTNYLILGIKAGSKLEKAKKFGIKVINEEELINLLSY